MTCTSMSAPMAHAFDPAQWLDNFAAVGGGYSLTDHALHLFVSVTGTTADEQRKARRLLESLTDAQRASVRAYVTGGDIRPVRRATIVSRPAAALSKASLRLVTRINDACRKHGLRWSRFGRMALRDPRFVRDLLRGRRPRQATVARVNALLADLRKHGREVTLRLRRVGSFHSIGMGGQ